MTLRVIRTTSRALVASEVPLRVVYAGVRFKPRKARWGGRAAARVPAGSNNCAKGGGLGLASGAAAKGGGGGGLLLRPLSGMTHPLSTGRDVHGTHTHTHEKIGLVLYPALLPPLMSLYIPLKGVSSGSMRPSAEFFTPPGPFMLVMWLSHTCRRVREGRGG